MPPSTANPVIPTRPIMLNTKIARDCPRSEKVLLTRNSFLVPVRNHLMGEATFCVQRRGLSPFCTGTWNNLYFHCMILAEINQVHKQWVSHSHIPTNKLSKLIIVPVLDSSAVFLTTLCCTFHITSPSKIIFSIPFPCFEIVKQHHQVPLKIT